jgi:endonuclease G, mitochondrial
LSRIFQRLTTGLGSLSLVSLILYGCSGLLPKPSSNVNLTFGNPSGANLGDPNNFLIERPQYVLSYNRSRGSANWASWQLTAAWLGTGDRPVFSPDLTLPVSWPQITPEDYTNSGFDRGHLVPAADRNRTAPDSAAVFLMTNIFPQAPDSNRGPWEKLERYCRDLAKAGNELYIMAGTYGMGGVGRRGQQQWIGDGKIAVPAQMWKVVVVQSQPDSGSISSAPQTRVIAVIMPNKQGTKRQRWQLFRTSVREIENLTGYNFFPNLPTTTQDRLETQVDNYDP